MLSLEVSKLKTTGKTTLGVRRNELSGAFQVALVLTLAVVIVGGLADWAYLNTQEASVSIIDGLSDYLTSYVSAFLIAGVEIGASYYFIEKYDLGDRKRLFVSSLMIGFVGFVGYVIAEVAAGLGSIGSSEIPVSQLLFNEYSPTVIDYGNALVILLSLFSLVALLKVLLRINPMPNTRNGISKSTGVLGGLWTSAITTFSAVVCCGPLPGAMALATGVSSIYFTSVINLQAYLVLVSIPLLLIAIVLADRRARIGCRLRIDSSK
ncbi:MAG: hypothetical protein JRN52_05760 [Nitrososphaerota archaeon]|nr:hypothetical protein [Nitrososphaerota archaeon]